jgi:hypothetical protein
MPVRPGPVTIVIGASSILTEDIEIVKTVEFFDRLEFDNTKLSSANTEDGIAPQYSNNIAAQRVQMEIAGLEAGERPIVPNSFDNQWKDVKQKIEVIQYGITSSSPETALPAALVEYLFGLYETHRAQLDAFEERKAIIAGDCSYEDLQTFRGQNIETLYFSGVSFTGPGISLSNVMVAEMTQNMQFAIPDGMGDYEVYKGYNIKLQKRTVKNARD